MALTMSKMSLGEAELVEAASAGASRDHDPVTNDLRKNSLEKKKYFRVLASRTMFREMFRLI